MDQSKIQIVIEYLQQNPQEIPAVINQINQIDKAAQQATTRIAGMSYYFRGGIDAIRLAAADGGPRAAFYAIDETLRGVLASGLSLSKIAPVLGIVAAAAAAGYAVWYEYTAGERAAAKAAADLQKEIKGVDDIITQIQKRQQAGLLGQATANELKQYLSGEIPLYKNSQDGGVTRTSTYQREKTFEAINYGTGLQQTVKTGQMETVQNEKATAEEIQKFVQDILQVQGKLDAQQVDALLKLRELQKVVHAESLTQLQQEQLAISNKYEAQRREIELNLAESRKVMTPNQIAAAEAAIQQSKANEQKERQEKEYEFQKKILEDWLRVKESMLTESDVKNKTRLEVEQKTTDESFKQKTISAEQWREQSLKILDVSVADEKAGALLKYDFEKDLREKLLKLVADPIERQKIRNDGLIAENDYQKQLIEITAKAAEKKIAIDQSASDKIRSLEQDRLRVIEEQNQALEKQFNIQLSNANAEERRRLEKNNPSYLKNSGLDIANDISTLAKPPGQAQLGLLQGRASQLQNQGGQLQSQMAKMQLAPPGTFSDADFEKLKQQIQANKDEQIKVAQEIKDAEQRINEERLQASVKVLGDMAAAAKAFGRAGFAEYKALAIAQATVATALAAIKAYNSVVDIPYVGPILGAIAAAAAVATGAAQIANIESQSYASGGLVTGPGTGTSDSIPINASNREFVVRNAVVDQPGAESFLRDFNARGMDAIRFNGNAVAGTRTTSSYSGGSKNGGPAGRDRSEGRNLHVGFVNTRNQLRTFMRQEGTKVIIDGLADHGNQVTS